MCLGIWWVARKVRVWNLWTRVSTSSLKDKQVHIRILSESTKFWVLHDDEALSNQDDQKVFRYHVDNKCLLVCDGPERTAGVPAIAAPPVGAVCRPAVPRVRTVCTGMGWVLRRHAESLVPRYGY